jgi:tetratricopeptide (TPR) repeat protein
VKQFVAFALVFLCRGQALPAQNSARPDLDELKARVRADSNAPELHYALAMGYWRDKKWDDAERELQVTVSIAPSYAEAWLARSSLFFARGEKHWKKEAKSLGVDSVRVQLLQALRDEHHAFLLDPMVDLAATGLADIGEPPRMPVGNGELIPGYNAWWISPVETSILEMRQGLYPDARRRLQGLIDDPRIGSLSSAPDLVLWFHALASAHSGDFRSAIDDFRMIRVRNDRHIVSWRGPRLRFPSIDLSYIMATAAFRGGYMTEAIEGFRAVIEADLSYYMAHAQLARIYTAAGAWDQAVAERHAAVDANPDDPSLLVDLGNTLIRSGRTAEAEEPLEEAGRLNPRDPLAPYLLGQALDKLGRAEDARAAFSRFLAIAPASYASQASEVRERLAR